MISARKASVSRTNLFSINHQTYEKLSSIRKLNNQQNSKSKEFDNIFITPIKLKKYSGLNSKNKFHSSASTRITTSRNYQTKELKNTLMPSYSLYKLSKINLTNKYPSLINTFYNSKLNQNTSKHKSRNIENKLQKTSTTIKRNTLNQYNPNSSSLSNISLMNNTVRNLSSSYKKFFLNKKKINITSTEKKNNNKKFILKNGNLIKNKKDKMEKNFINNKMIKSILDVKRLQNKIQYDLNKKIEKIKKKLNNENNEHINEFSFNQDYIVDNYYIENNPNKKWKNNNNIEINLVNKKGLSNLIQSNIITSFPELERNKKIYEENYECETPKFTKLEPKNKIIF